MTNKQRTYILDLINKQATYGLKFEEQLKHMIKVSHIQFHMTDESASQFISILRHEYTLFDVAVALYDGNLINHLFGKTGKLPKFAKFIQAFFDASTKVETEMDDAQESALVQTVLESIQ